MVPQERVERSTRSQTSTGVPAGARSSNVDHLLTKEGQRGEHSTLLRRAHGKRGGLTSDVRLDHEGRRDASVVEALGVVQENLLVEHAEQDEVVRVLVPGPCFAG